MVQETISFKEISHPPPWWPFLFGGVNPFVQFILEGIMRKFGPVAQVQIMVKDMSYHQLWSSFCSAERIYMYNLYRGHYEKYFFDII